MSTEEATATATADDAADNSPPPLENPMGCYLVYEPDSSGKLMLYYKKEFVPDAVGFWSPGPNKKIQGFKFNQNQGRSELIKGIAGGDANKKKYYVGWVQFIKAAKGMNGSVMKFPNKGPGLEVDVYVYRTEDGGPTMLELDDGLVDVSDIEALAVLPKHNDVYTGVKVMDMTTFLTKATTAGGASSSV